MLFFFFFFAYSSDTLCFFSFFAQCELSLRISASRASWVEIFVRLPFAKRTAYSQKAESAVESNGRRRSSWKKPEMKFFEEREFSVDLDILLYWWWRHLSSILLFALSRFSAISFFFTDDDVTIRHHSFSYLANSLHKLTIRQKCFVAAFCFAVEFRANFKQFWKLFFEMIQEVIDPTLANQNHLREVTKYSNIMIHLPIKKEVL